MLSTRSYDKVHFVLWISLIVSRIDLDLRVSRYCIKVIKNRSTISNNKYSLLLIFFSHSVQNSSALKLRDYILVLDCVE
ncbi:uncharacterized protein Smp_202230 [Schistosoma mansoni]|uniref:uncharacterized protein n=1 Tax=Schistosoma mansoni TaxID=6183 RepID=UPI00022DC4B3|nr:uncharacterized protein Smp_202230 [Schistosoma mansoni]|eukprot:XP_018651022.1 uncharacterized protein Smp_202230 [Schistosoma mansoni]